jgi:GT2 family glycosyltransferase
VTTSAHPDRRDPAQPSGRPADRVTASAKFLFSGGSKLEVRGVTYGPFAPCGPAAGGFVPATVDRDFAHMAANAINAIRVYDVPPRWLLDAAGERGLLVMVGLPWEQHVAFLDEPRRPRAIEDQVRRGVAECAGHPAVLCYAIGNEIPAPIVRWHERHRIERHLERLYRAAKSEDPSALVTYVNYPSTEYLRLGFLDLVSFNVYLEERRRFGAYLARLQNIAEDRPLLLAEVGLDSRRNGEDGQARALAWQLRDAFEGGCAGTFAFAWTDEWHRGGFDIEGWDFGLTARDRRPKPALEAARSVYAEAPFGPREWPAISVVVCSYNGAATIGECLTALESLDYPDYEVVVVSDGSTDATAVIAAASGARVIETANCGLSSARNTGLAAARGEIVAYTDDDTRPDEHWLKFLAHTFMTTDHAAVGGPNMPMPGDGSVAACVAAAPGGPTHVLLSDTEAEHIPGCNMAFRRERLEALGGFDPTFRVAGDDVDICWRAQELGWTIGFSPAAVVWHHRRASTRAYLRQQRGYGEAEALLERKWPSKYSATGQLAWAGRLYGGPPERAGRRWRVYYGTWGSSLFQSLYRPQTGVLGCLARIPDWYMAVAALAALSALGVLWWPLLLAGALPAASLGALLADAMRGAARASFPAPFGRRRGLVPALRVLTGALHILQPLSRLSGRARRGLTPWRSAGAHAVSLPHPLIAVRWDERWQAPEERLHGVEAALQAAGAVTRRGGPFDRWDLEIRGGALGAARLRMVVEEHGAGRQLVRCRCWPRVSLRSAGVVLGPAAVAAAAAISGASVVGWLLGAVAAGLGARAGMECGRAQSGALGLLHEREAPGAVPRRRRLRLPGPAHIVERARLRSLATTLLVGALCAYAVGTSADRPHPASPPPPRADGAAPHPRRMPVSRTARHSTGLARHHPHRHPRHAARALGHALPWTGRHTADKGLASADVTPRASVAAPSGPEGP